MTEWREGHAAALEHEAAELAKTLVELDNAHAILLTRGRGNLCAEVRSLASALRMEQASMTGEARELRAAGQSGELRHLPMSITTRRPTR